PYDLYSDHPWSPPRWGHSSDVRMFEIAPGNFVSNARPLCASRFGRSDLSAPRANKKRSPGVTVARPEGYVASPSMAATRCAVRATRDAPLLERPKIVPYDFRRTPTAACLAVRRF